MAKHFTLTTDEPAKASSVLAAAGRANLAAGDSPELLRHVWIDLDPVDSERRRAIVLTPDRARELAAELVKAANNAEGPGHRRRPKPQEDRER